MKRTVYIAGPVSSLPVDEARRAFDAAEERLKQMGHEPFNPTRIPGWPRCGCEAPDGTAEDGHGRTCRYRKDIAALVTSDAIYLLEGWENSRGARNDLALAIAAGLHIMLEPTTSTDCTACGGSGIPYAIGPADYADQLRNAVLEAERFAKSKESPEPRFADGFAVGLRLAAGLFGLIEGVDPANRARLMSATDERTLTETERAVWAAWNRLPDDAPSPVKRITTELGMAAADVAAIVYPEEAFGAWDDSQEPDLT